MADSQVDDRPQLKHGDLVASYEVLSFINRGGMGEVYLAQDRRLGRKVALKFLLPSVTQNADRLRRFEHEARAASALNHPNIITIYEVTEAAAAHIIATEFVEGETLRSRMLQGPLSVSDSVSIAIQIGEALSAAHKAGIIHRDIKPENIMLRPDGIVKVLDFGLAKLSDSSAISGGLSGGQDTDPEAPTRLLFKTSPGLVMGTVGYMSPEQVRGRELDAATDIFSLGIVLYEMLTGRSPFEADTTGDVIAAILKTDAALPSSLNQAVPPELDEIVSRSLAKERVNRYQTARELVADLRQSRKHLEFSVELERVGLAGYRADSKQNSIAVLPFTNMSNDTENEYFCDGLAEELLNALAKIDDLRVAARTSAFSFKGKNTGISEIGRALKVNSVLEGSVRKSGNRVRITAQLINASDGYHLWSERYDREMQDIFDVQDEITLAIVDTLKVKLLGGKRATLLKRYTDDPEAFELYLKGRHHLHNYTSEGWTNAIALFEQVIERAPRYAPAHAGMAFCLGHLWYYGLLSPNEVIPRWKAASKRALELDDQLAEAHDNQGNLQFFYEWNWPAAEQAYKRAIELAPSSADVHLWYATFLVSAGRSDEAVSEGKRAQLSDPLSLLVNLNVGWIYVRTHRLDDALEQVQRMMEIEPEFYGAHWLLGRILYTQGNYDEAIAALQKSLSLRVHPIALSTLGAVYGRMGRRNEALAVIQQLMEMKREQRAIDIARVYAELGERDLAFEWLNKACDERSGEMVYFDRLEFWEDLREDPRYQEVLTRIGLPAGRGHTA